MTKPIIVVKVPCKLLYVIQVKEFLIKCSTSWPYLISEFLVAYITIVASDWPRTFFTPKVFLFICLTGTYDKDGTESGGTIGWSVTYNNTEHGNSKSTATWSGQRQLTLNGSPIIPTTWLLTSQTVPSNNWESTLTNQDLFQRTFPVDEEIRASLIARNFKEHMCK